MRSSWRGGAGGGRVEDAIASVEELTGRTVTAFMSANHIDPDLAAELFVLEPAPEMAPSDGAR
jgi:hypothetical protein